MTELVLRLVFSLAVVIGLLALVARVAARRFRGSPGAVVTVLHRQSISRHAVVAVVAVGGRVLVLGTTEHQVRTLAELDPAELDVDGLDPAELDLADPGDAPEAAAVRPLGGPGVRPVPRLTGRHRAPAAVEGPLTGSVLSPTTWRRAVAAVTERAS